MNAADMDGTVSLQQQIKAVIGNSLDLLIIAQDAVNRAVDGFVNRRRAGPPLVLLRRKEELEAAIDGILGQLRTHLLVATSCLAMGFDLPHGQQRAEITKVSVSPVAEGILIRVTIRFRDFENEEIPLSAGAIIPATFTDA